MGEIKRGYTERGQGRGESGFAAVWKAKMSTENTTTNQWASKCFCPTLWMSLDSSWQITEVVLAIFRTRKISFNRVLRGTSEHKIKAELLWAALTPQGGLWGLHQSIWRFPRKDPEGPFTFKASDKRKGELVRALPLYKSMEYLSSPYLIVIITSIVKRSLWATHCAKNYKYVIIFDLTITLCGLIIFILQRKTLRPQEGWSIRQKHIVNGVRTHCIPLTL